MPMPSLEDNSKKMKTWWLKLFALALFLRVVLAAFLYHTDLKGIYHEARLVSRFGWNGGYEKGVEENTPLHYPPPIYFLFGSYQKIAAPLFSGYFNKWMEDGGGLSIRNHPAIFRDLLVMKLPIVAADFLVAWLVMLLVSEERKRIVASLWLLNPFSLFAVYAFAHFDIIPTALILAAVVLWYRKKKGWSYLALGLAGGFKVFPLLLLPFWVLLDERGWKERVRDFGLCLGVFFASLFPIITSKAAMGSVFLSNLTGGLTRASFDIGNHEQLPLYMVFFALSLMAAAAGFLRKIPLEAVPVAVFGVFLGLSNFHPQWAIWIMPFLAVLVVRGLIAWHEALVALVAYVWVVFLIDDIYMSFGLLKAINDASDSLPTIRWWADGLGSQLQGSFHAFFLAAIIWVVFQVFRRLKQPLELFSSSFLRLFDLGRATALWVLTLVGLFVVVHVPLALKGKYVDNEYLVQTGTIPLTNSTIVSQRLTISNPNFTGLSIRMKNVNLANKNDVFFTLSDQTVGGELNFKINGGAIGDDFDLKINFKPLPFSKNHTYLLTISSPQAPSGAEGAVFVPFDGSVEGGGLTVGGKQISGRLVFATYYRPGGLVENLKFSVANIASKI